MLIIKALYGLHGSGKSWATKLGAILRKEGWEISKADPKAWMRHNKDLNLCEYIGSHVDDLVVAAQDPEAFFAALREK